MGLVSNFEFMKTKDIVTQVFLMLELSYMKSGVRLLKVGFVAWPTRMGGLS
jgi:hypothetical protein